MSEKRRAVLMISATYQKSKLKSVVFEISNERGTIQERLEQYLNILQKRGKFIGDVQKEGEAILIKYPFDKKILTVIHFYEIPITENAFFDFIPVRYGK